MRLITCLILPSSLTASEAVEAPWEKNAFDVETGIGWQVSTNTPISYRLITTQFSWRTPYHFKFNHGNDSKTLVRSRWSLMATLVDEGPEDYFLSVAGGPSIEWWSPNDQWSLYFSAGGGVGVTNSTGEIGGQGQDFIFNWYARTGLRYQLNEDLGIYGGASFVHHSNRGATDPNPGIDSLGFTLGISFSF